MHKPSTIAALAAALCAVAGCFDEPTPAYKTVSPEQRVYLNDKGMKDLAGAKFAPNADYLNLDRNHLTNVDAVATLTGLKWLRLNDNQLSALPDLRNLTSLRRIYLKNNRFTAVPETLKDLESLTDIDLSGNPIREVPAWLVAKKGLKNINLSRTQITKLPDDLSAWKGLQSLQLGELALSADEMKRIRAAFEPKENPLGTAIVF